MISNPDVAKPVSDLMIDICRKIEDSIRLVHQECSAEESKVYRLAAARIIAEVYLDVMTPLYRVHPSLRPEGMNDVR